jgi:hypothetical protein
LVGDQQDGEKKRHISTPVNAFSAIVGEFSKRNLKKKNTELYCQKII